MLFDGREDLPEMTILNWASEINRMVKKLQKKASGEIHFCCEAGVFGFSLLTEIFDFGRFGNFCL